MGLPNPSLVIGVSLPLHPLHPILSDQSPQVLLVARPINPLRPSPEHPTEVPHLIQRPRFQKMCLQGMFLLQRLEQPLKLTCRADAQEVVNMDSDGGKA